MLSIRRNSSPARTASGQALIEGTVALVLIVAVSIGLLYFVISSAMTAYYKQQLGFICTQSASYAAGRPSTTAQADTAAFVGSMEQQMNMGTGVPHVTVSQTDINGTPGKSVSVEDSFSVLGVGRGVWNISLSATAVAATTSSGNNNNGGATQPSGWYTVYNDDANGNPQSFAGWIPVYSSPSSGNGASGRFYAWPP